MTKEGPLAAAPSWTKPRMKVHDRPTQAKKRKSELDNLDPPSPLPSRTRQKKSQTAPSPARGEPVTTPVMQPEEKLPPRIRTKQHASKTKAAAFDTKQFYPFISLKAKTAYEETLRGKLPIKERSLDLDNADHFIKDIIHTLGWQQFCGKPDEGALSLVKEFYANMECLAEGKVFVRGIWVTLSSEELNKVINTPDHDEDAYSVMMEHGVEPDVITKKLCRPNDEIIWSTGKNNQPLSFSTSALLPQMVPLFKFICSRLIPTTHTSHVTMDRATLLLAMIEKRNVDAGWIIYNNIIDSPGPAKALWFPAIITKLCVNAGIEIAKGEEKVKAGLQINTKSSVEAPAVGGQRTSIQILEELQQINKALQQLPKFISQQQAWNKFMEDAWNQTIRSINPPIFDAGPSGATKKKTPQAKAKPPMSKKTTVRRETSESEEEEIAAHLGGSDPLTGRFTTANLSSEDEDDI